MAAFVSLGSESFGDLPEAELTRPVTVKQVSLILNKRPFQIIADLMALDCFASIQSELSDRNVESLGVQYGIRFRITG